MKNRESLNQIVRYFVTNNGGFMIVSQDSIFIRLFRGMLKVLDVPEECLQCEKHDTQPLKTLRELLTRFSRIIIFIESTIDGKNNTPYFRQIKDILDDKVIIICICNESGKDTMRLFLEMGADNTIVKPASIDTMVKKIAFTIKPNNFRSMVTKAKAAIEKNNLAVARVVAEELLKANPESTIANILMGDIYKRKKEYENAEQSYKKASISDRMHIEPLERLVALYDETGKLQNKLNVLNLLDRISPLNHERKMVIGDTYAQLGNTCDSIAYYDDALRLVQRQANEMLSYARMGVGKKLSDIDPERSLRYMSEAIELKAGEFTEKDLWMFNEIGIGLRKRGKWDKAIEYYNRALEVCERDWGLSYNIAMAYFQGKEYAKAREHMEEALEYYPEVLNVDAHIPYNIGRIYYHLGNYPEALQYVKMACVNDHNFRPALQMLRELEDGRGNDALSCQKEQ